MAKGQSQARTGLPEALKREFRSLPDKRLAELEEWIKELFTRYNLQRNIRVVEAVEFSKTQNTLTVFTKRWSIECGFHPQFGAPRFPLREYILGDMEVLRNYRQRNEGPIMSDEDREPPPGVSLPNLADWLRSGHSIREDE